LDLAYVILVVFLHGSLYVCTREIAPNGKADPGHYPGATAAFIAELPVLRYS
jgi:hypothetical protein